MATGSVTPDGNNRQGLAPAAAGGGGPGGPGQGGQQGGMPMGGMGGMGQGGGDTTRGGSKWRTQGQLFEEDDPAAHFSGVVGEDPAQRAARPPKRG